MSISKAHQQKYTAVSGWMCRSMLASAVFIALASAGQAVHAQSVSVAPVTAPVVDDTAQTVYPIILVTGLTGSPENALGQHYWYNMDTGLASHGATIYVSDLSNFQGDEGANGRGEQLIKIIQAVLAQTGATKVNLIGHSQGGLTSRYAAYVRPDLVASVTTFDTPHHGTTVADLVQNILNVDPTGILENDVVGPLVNAFFTAFGGGGQTNQNSAAALAELTTAGVAQFNQDIPSPGVGSFQNCTTGSPTETLSYNGGTYTHVLFSVTGTAVQPNALTTLPAYDDSLRLLDPAPLESPEYPAEDAAGNYMVSQTVSEQIQEPTDGLVSQCSGLFGDVLDDNYHWIHTDAVDNDGILGAYSENPISVIVAQASRLKGMGD